MQNYKRMHARESTRHYPLVRSCLNFFGQGSSIREFRKLREIHLYEGLWHTYVVRWHGAIYQN